MFMNLPPHFQVPQCGLVAILFLVWNVGQISGAATTSAPFDTGTVSGNGGDIFDTANLHASTGESPQSTLSPWAGGLRAGAPSRPQFDVQCGDAPFLALGRSILRRQHRRIGRRLIAVRFDLHAPSDTRNRLSSGQISHML